MWISWDSPRTGKAERIYNYYDIQTDIGEKAVEIARHSLSEKFNLPQDAIPGFRVEEAPWLTPDERHPDPGNTEASSAPGAPSPSCT